MPTPSEQLLSRTIYDIDGTTTVWNFSFTGGYLDPSHVKAYTELPTGVRTPVVVTPEMLIGEFQLQISPALPPSAGVLVIYRDTPKDLPLVDFVEGPLSEIALDTNAKQAVFIAAEAQDTINTSNLQAAIDAQVAAQVAAEQANIDANTATNAASAAGSSALIASNAATAAVTTVAALAGPTGSALVGFQQPGGVARTAESKLRESVSVKDFGAVGDGVTDDWAAIQYAVDNIPTSSVLYFPKGFYRISQPVVITRNSVKLIGQATGASVISNMSTTTSAVIWTPTTFGPGTFIDSGAFRDISITRPNASATAGYGLELINCNGFALRDVAISQHANSIRVAGGQNNSLDRFICFSRVGSGLPAIAGSSLLRFESGPRDSGVNIPCYTTQVSNFSLSGTPDKTVQDVIVLNSADGLNFSNGYVNFGSASLLRLEPIGDGSTGNITATAFSNVYFDCVGTVTGTPNGVYAAASPYTGTIAHVRFGTGCFIGNGPGTGILGEVGAKLRGLFITGTNISSFTGKLIDISGETGTNGLRFSLVGCSLRSASNGGVKVSSARHLAIANNSFADISSANGAIETTGDIAVMSITGNAFGGTTADFVNTATSTTLVVSGNASANGTNTVVGSRIGNKVSADPLMLDWYEETSFTPTLTIGGSSTGITYSAQVGRSTRIGNRVMFTASVTLTSKGANTGEVRIAGLPFTSVSDISSACAIRASNVAGDLGAAVVMADVVAGTGQLRISQMNISGGLEFAEPITDAYLTATSTFNISGSYQAA